MLYASLQDETNVPGRPGQLHRPFKFIRCPPQDRHAYTITVKMQSHGLKDRSAMEDSGGEYRMLRQAMPTALWIVQYGIWQRNMGEGTGHRVSV